MQAPLSACPTCVELAGEPLAIPRALGQDEQARRARFKFDRRVTLWDLAIAFLSFQKSSGVARGRRGSLGVDAFEELISEILWMEGYWVRTSFKVELTKAEKVLIDRRSSPRWELDVVAFQGGG